MTEYPKNIYGGHAPYSAPDTSKTAAEMIMAHSENLREAVMLCVAQSADRGMTCEEIEVLLGRPHSSISARLCELHQLKRIDHKGTRQTRYKRPARVWKLPKHIEKDDG
jgi:hypothetical protein